MSFNKGYVPRTPPGVISKKYSPTVVKMPPPIPESGYPYLLCIKGKEPIGFRDLCSCIKVLRTRGRKSGHGSVIRVADRAVLSYLGTLESALDDAKIDDDDQDLEVDTSELN